MNRAGIVSAGHERLDLNLYVVLPRQDQRTLVKRLVVDGALVHEGDDRAAAELADVFARLEKEENRRERGYLELQRQYLRELVLLAQRNMLDAASLPLSNNYRLIEDAVSYIGQNYASDLSLSSVASEFGVSPAHFSRLFKSVVGIGFNEYLTDLRISHAEKLLLDKMSVSQTAFMCGFNDSNYFSAVFKKHKGITPKKLQMQKKGM